MLVPVGNRQILQDALQKMINDLHFAKKLGNEARKTRDIYDPDVIYGQWEKMLEDISESAK